MRMCLNWCVPAVMVGLLGMPCGLADERPAPKVQPLLSVEHAGLSSMLVSPKDKRLADALALIPTRLSEIPNEFPNAKTQDVWAVRQVVMQLARPMRLGVLYNLEHAEGGAWGYGAAASFLTATEADARAFDTLARGALDQNRAALPFPPGPSDRVEGMTDAMLPFGLLTFGARKAADGWRYEALFGSIDASEDIAVSLPDGFLRGATIARAALDFKALTPAANMLRAAAGGNDPNVPMLLDALAEAGVIGAEGMSAVAGAAFTEDALIARAHVKEAARLRDKLGLLGGALSREDLAAIPGDAGFVVAGRFNLVFLDRLLAFAMEQNPEVAWQVDRFNEWFGVDLRADVLAGLGGVGAAYIAESTAGGSPLGLVVMSTFADRARFLEAHDKILTGLNELLLNVPPEAPGIGNIARWSDESLPGVTLFSMRVRGVPLPLEVTYAVTDRWLIAGLLPQAVVGAARQAVGKGDAGLAGRPEIAALFGGAGGPAAIAFVDAPRYVPKGYAYTSLLGSAVANGVRSRTQPQREPGLVVPPLAELRSGARPMIAAFRWEGRDLLMDAGADRSMLVNVSAALGIAQELLPVAALLGLTGDEK